MRHVNGIPDAIFLLKKNVEFWKVLTIIKLEIDSWILDFGDFVFYVFFLEIGVVLCKLVFFII